MVVERLGLLEQCNYSTQKAERVRFGLKRLTVCKAAGFSQ